jgi:hypothetical protein
LGGKSMHLASNKNAWVKKVTLSVFRRQGL